MNQASPHTFGKNITLFIRCNAVLIVLTGLAVMWGWIAQSSLLVQISAQYSSMKFNTAAALVLAGLALLAVKSNYRRTALFLGLLGSVLPLLTFFEYCFEIDIGIDDLFVTPFIKAHVRYPGRMAPNTLATLLLVDFTICAYVFFINNTNELLQRRTQLVMAICGSLIAAMGVVPIVGYMGGIQAAHTWGNFAGMALHTAICFFLLGVSLVACAWKRSAAMPFWLGVPVAIGFLVISLSIWLAVRSYEDIRFEQSLQLEAGYISGRIGDRLTAFYAAIDRISNRWMVAGGTPRALWESDAQGYLQGYPFLKAIERVDRDDYLQWAVPMAGNEKLLGVKLNTQATRAEALQKAQTTHTSQVTKSIAFIQGGVGFLYMSPVFLKDRFDGLVVAAFTIDDIINKILSRDKNGPFYVIVTEDDKTAFSNAPVNFVPSERWQKSFVMKNRDNAWTVTVYPTPEMMTKKDSPLQLLVLITGLVTSILATFSVLLALKTRRSAEKIRMSEERLHQIINTHSMVTTTDFDIQIFMNNAVERIQEMTQAAGAVIELVEKDEMLYQAVSGSVAAFHGMRLKRKGSLSGLCVDRREIMISHDTSIDPRVDAEACKKIGVSSMIIVPLIQRGAVFGILKVVSATTHAFQEQDTQSLQLMAGLLGGALGQQLEIEQRQKLEEQLRHMAQNDSLTNLPNRMLFKDRLSHAILNNVRNGSILAVMYMDIDHFKTINDVHGHAQGDTLLKQFSVRTTNILRRGDTLARLGGDEFTLIAENLKSATDAENLAAKIVEASRLPFDLPNGALKISVSIGVAVLSKSEADPDVIVGRADEALYEAKRAGRDGFRLVSI